MQWPFREEKNSLTQLTYKEGMKYHSRGLFYRVVKHRQPEKVAKVHSIQEGELNS